MDSRGWISIDVIAKFPRVLALTPETHLVVEVLGLSSLVEVRDMYVRPHQWAQFILPTAPPSLIEGAEGQVLDPPVAPSEAAPQGTAVQNQEEDEEEDVVFVL